MLFTNLSTPQPHNKSPIHKKWGIDDLADFIRNDWKELNIEFLDLKKFDGFKAEVN
jgi:hypothetical protein